MFGRLDVLGYASCCVEIMQRLVVVVGLDVDAGKGDERVYGVPLVLHCLHRCQRRFIFVDSLTVIVGLFVQFAEVYMTKRDAELVVYLQVQSHRLAEVGKSRVRQSSLAEHGAYVGVVYGLSQ